MKVKELIDQLKTVNPDLEMNKEIEKPFVIENETLTMKELRGLLAPYTESIKGIRYIANVQLTNLIINEVGDNDLVFVHFNYFFGLFRKRVLLSICGFVIHHNVKLISLSFHSKKGEGVFTSLSRENDHDNFWN